MVVKPQEAHVQGGLGEVSRARVEEAFHPSLLKLELELDLWNWCFGSGLTSNRHNV
jgi:hypothetical protein